DRLRTADRLPTTSQPSIGDFLDTYEPLVREGLDVVSVHISGGIFGTRAAARQAKEQLAERVGSDRVTVIDSERACGGLGVVVLAGGGGAAGRRARAGGGRAGGRPGGEGRRRARRGDRGDSHGPGGPQDVVRDRHARVPAPGRAH